MPRIYQYLLKFARIKIIMKTTKLLWMMLVPTLTAMAGEIVLFDASTTLKASVTSHSGGKFAWNGSVLEIETKGETGYPGILVKGTWDLSQCNQLTLELACRENRGDLPLTIRLDNPDADPGKSTGVFVDRVKVSGKGFKILTVNLPPTLPQAREVSRKLFGMKRSPFASMGVVADLDVAKVVGVAVYLKEPKLDWRWSIKRIVAHTGPVAEVPPWMQMSAEQFFPFIDVYGQFKHKEWPGKTHSDTDLQKARERERADLAAHPGPGDWNQYGGWAKGPKQAATGRFRVEKIDGKWWMVDPEGCLYWSHGPVRVTPSGAVTPLDGREFYFTDLPKEGTPFAKFYTTRDESLYLYYVARNIQRTYDFSSANALRKYGANWYETYSQLAHQRLRSWGMNTVANCSEAAICRMRKTPYTDRFELKSPDIEGSHLGWWKFKDPFHPEFRTNFRKQLVQRKAELDDPWCFGFFVDNEISWGGDTTLAEWVLQSPATQSAKIEMVNRLKQKYSTITGLNATWKGNYADWDALLNSQQKPPPGAQADCAAFTVAITEAYFKNIRDEFKAVAPNTLYLGCRFAGSTKAAIQIGAKYCDVISYNLYRHTLDDFKLPEGVDKPMMIGEFHFGALDRGMFHPSLIQVADQAARGAAYETYLTSALRHPNIIGAHWHQFGEQATSGRFDGENLQNGLLDVCDTPYWETINACRRVGATLYSTRYQAQATAK
jgi:hypothetical protein